jgi:hypothetical protein
MNEYVTNNERMNVVIYHVTEFNDTMKTFQRKEHIKILGNAAEIFQEKMMQFMAKVLAFYAKRIKDVDQSLHVVLADTMGVIVHEVFRNVQD